MPNKHGQSLLFLPLVGHTDFTVIISKLKSFKVTILLAGFSTDVLTSLKLAFPGKLTAHLKENLEIKCRESSSYRVITVLDILHSGNLVIDWTTHCNIHLNNGELVVQWTVIFWLCGL